MSWSPDLYIGELRPWPDSVRVVRGKTDEARRYMPERKDAQEALERRIDELCAEVERLRQELAIRESSEQEKVIDYLGKECADWEDKYLALAGENAKLRELMYERAHVYAIQNMTEDELRIATTNVMEDNAKLREQVEYMTPIALYAASEQERDRMRELGVEL